jgi:RND family efflux transporter MFP subunit
MIKKMIKGIAILGLLLFMQACSDKSSEQKTGDKKKAAPLLEVEVINIKNDKIPIWIEYNGKAKAVQKINVQARIKGILEKKYFEDGSKVKKGDKLFEIEKDKLEAELAQAEAKYKKDSAKLKLAQTELNRYSPLAKEGLVALSLLDKYIAQVSEMKEVTKYDKEQIKRAKLQLSYATIYSEIDGIIGKNFVDIGNLVGPGTKNEILAEIIKNDEMYVYFNPTQLEYQIISKYKKDKIRAVVKVPNSDNKLINMGDYYGYVDFSGNKVDEDTGTISMRAKIKNKNGLLLHGTYVNINILFSEDFAIIVIPPEIIFEDQGGRFVYVVGKEDKVEKRYITKKFETKYYVIVDKGLKAGDRVIVSGFAKIQPGIKIKPIDATDKKSVLATLKAKGFIESSK